MKEKQPNAEVECKQHELQELLKVKLQNPELYEQKNAEDWEHARMYRLRNKLGLIKPVETPHDTVTEEVQLSSCSFNGKQSLSKSVNKAQESPAS